LWEQTNGADSLPRRFFHFERCGERAAV